MIGDIQTRTNNKLKENQQAKTHSWTFQSSSQKRQYSVFAGVFSPAIFLGTHWLTQQVLAQSYKGIKFLQIGTGCGVTAIEVALRFEDAQVVASDINQEAVKNATDNIKRHKVKVEVFQSDMFKSLPMQQFDIIYWNYPFHCSEFQFNNLVEKAVRDPNYKMLSEYLKEAGSWLNQKGSLLMGFSEKMGNIPLLLKVAQQNNWNCHKLATMDQDNGWISCYKLTKK